MYGKVGSRVLRIGVPAGTPAGGQAVPSAPQEEGVTHGLASALGLFLGYFSARRLSTQGEVEAHLYVPGSSGAIVWDSGLWRAPPRLTCI